jgi:hypothetical protein
MCLQQLTYTIKGFVAAIADMVCVCVFFYKSVSCSTLFKLSAVFVQQSIAKLTPLKN